MNNLTSILRDIYNGGTHQELFDSEDLNRLTTRYDNLKVHLGLTDITSSLKDIFSTFNEFLDACEKYNDYVLWRTKYHKVYKLHIVLNFDDDFCDITDVTDTYEHDGESFPITDNYVWYVINKHEQSKIDAYLTAERADEILNKLNSL